MKKNAGFMSYADVAAAAKNGRTHLLLGNGFSIACDAIFSYGKLYDAALAAGLSKRAQAVFDRLGTNNFEAVMRLLDDGDWLARNYGLIKGKASELLTDLEVIKKSLVSAVAASHLDDASKVPEKKKLAAAAFLKPYHHVFTTSYDLLLYWVNMCAGDKPPYGDGFRGEWEDPAAETVVFTEHLGQNQGIYYLHGALHLFVAHGEVRKHCWCRSNRRLMELIREGLHTAKYPLFVAEGDHEKKLEQIHRSGYLSYCLGKLGRVENRLVVLGMSFGDSDQHIANAVADNPKIAELYVGVFGDEKSAPARAIKVAMDKVVQRREQMSTARRGIGVKQLAVNYFNSATANVWG